MKHLSQFILLVFLGCLILNESPALSKNLNIINVFRPVNLGDSEDPPEKDYIINAGLFDGVQIGSLLEVLRKLAHYDALRFEFYEETTIPIAQIKVISIGQNTAVTRWDQWVPLPNASSQYYSKNILIGDEVRPLTPSAPSPQVPH